MTRFLKIFLTLLTITIVGFGLYYYFNDNSTDDNKVDDKTNIENTVKSETNSQENIEGTVVTKRSTENN
ncbi:hypothetical protein [Gemella haemolysans]|uniref:hypothetical protein n=1 Tax=Gemella haemolysans TaxID=1379 RepID=UPI00195CDC67|nr:hypothetical protein [Gemella haemolysans]VTX85271.1 Uncharacterised protein [Gemella haemolysans]